MKNSFPTRRSADMQKITSTASRMEMMAEQIVQTDELGSEFLALALPNADHPTHSAGTLRQAALTTIESIVGALNVSIPGRFLFAGIDGDQQALQEIGRAHV